MSAFQVALVSMNAHVFVKVALLSERLAAAEDWAHKRLLLGVRAEMIEEIVPLFKASCAGFELIQENLCPPLALRLEIFYILKRA